MPAALARLLHQRTEIDDTDFDRLYPSSQRPRSSLHWTPIEVATRAVELLAPNGEHVLDVGSGVGKLCLVGAATTAGTWVGIEQDAEMVRVARAAAASMRLDHRVTFVHGDIADVDWATFDSFYLFNPFAETLFAGDGDPLERRDRYIENIHFAQQQIARVAVGTRVVTFHGFGGDMPPGFREVVREQMYEGDLCLWIKDESRS